MQGVGDTLWGVGRWRQTSKKEEGKHKITNKQTNKYQLQTVLVTVRRKYRYCEKEKQVEDDLNYTHA